MLKYKDMTYTVRKDGRLMKKITINGKTKYIYSSDAKNLYDQYNELMYLKYNGININSDTMLKDYALKWLEFNSAGKEVRTVEEYNSIINNHIIPAIGFKKIKDIKKYDIEQLLSNMQNIPTTANKTLGYIKRILNDAIDNDIIIKNVANNIKPFKIVKNERKPLTIEEDKLLINSKHKYAPFFILMRYTGMRKEEIIPLTVNDVNLKNKTISINKAVVLLHNQPIIKSTKNNRIRTIPILDNVYNIVTDLIANSKNGLLFTKETDGKMLTDVAVRRHLESFLYNLNINSKNPIRFTCHQLRHSYCTMLYYAGIKIKKAQALMGHSSASMVYEIYTHLDEQRENSINLINNYIKNVNKTKIKGIKRLSKSCQYIKIKK